MKLLKKLKPYNVGIKYNKVNAVEILHLYCENQYQLCGAYILGAHIKIKNLYLNRRNNSCKIVFWKNSFYS